MTRTRLASIPRFALLAGALLALSLLVGACEPITASQAPAGSAGH